MASGIGSKSTLSYIEETVYGTFPSAQAGTGIGFISESIANSRNPIQSTEINPNRTLTSLRSGNVQAGGAVNIELSGSVLGKFWKHLLMSTDSTSVVTPTALANSQACTRGSYYSSNTRAYLCTRSGTTAANATTSGLLSVDSSTEEVSGTVSFQYIGPVASTITKHTMAGGVTKPTGGLSFERMVYLDSGSQFFAYTGGRINSFSVQIPQEGIVTATLDLMFKDLLSTATATKFSGTPAIPADDPFVGIQAICRIKPAGGSYADDMSLTSGSFSISNNFDGNIYAMSSKYRRDLVEQTRSCTGSVSAIFEDMTKFNYFANESVFALEFSFHHLGTWLKVEFPNCKFTGGQPTPVISGPGVVSTSFDFTAFAPSGTDVNVEMINLVTAAY